MAASFTFTKILNSSLSLSLPADAVIRSEMSDGYASQYKRFSNDFLQYQMTYLLTDAQRISFFSWWQSNATAFFDFVDPTDDSTKQGRINGAFSLKPFTINQDYFTLDLTIERVL